MSLEGRWVVSELAVGGELVPPLDGTRITMEIDAGRVHGLATINRYTGVIGEDGGLGPLATTRMAGPEEELAQEGLFLRLLGRVGSFEIEEDEMRLLSSGLILVVLHRA